MSSLSTTVTQVTNSLSTLVSTTRTHYVGVNDGGVAQGSYQNDGATGQCAIAEGVNASAAGANAVALGVGANARAIGSDATAIGTGAVASGANSVALGSGSVAAEANTVSVGSSGSGRRITNVAAGVNPTDAVNVSQLRSVQQSVNARGADGLRGRCHGRCTGRSAAGRTRQVVTMGAGIGTFGGYTAIAIGGSMRFTPNVIAKMGFSTTCGSRMMFNAGFGYSW